LKLKIPLLISAIVFLANSIMEIGFCNKQREKKSVGIETAKNKETTTAAAAASKSFLLFHLLGSGINWLKNLIKN
jgi:hypothetical protein